MPPGISRSKYPPVSTPRLCFLALCKDYRLWWGGANHQGLGDGPVGMFGKAADFVWLNSVESREQIAEAAAKIPCPLMPLRPG